ncbi:MAG: hypothetical protein SGPRY_005241 [Prymnesium sp.]
MPAGRPKKLPPLPDMGQQTLAWSLSSKAPTQTRPAPSVVSSSSTVVDLSSGMASPQSAWAWTNQQTDSSSSVGPSASQTAPTPTSDVVNSQHQMRRYEAIILTEVQDWLSHIIDKVALDTCVQGSGVRASRMKWNRKRKATIVDSHVKVATEFPYESQKQVIKRIKEQVNDDAKFLDSPFLWGSAEGNMQSVFCIVKCASQNPYDLSRTTVLKNLMRDKFAVENGWELKQWARDMALPAGKKKNEAGEAVLETKKCARPYLLHQPTGDVITATLQCVHTSLETEKFKQSMRKTLVKVGLANDEVDTFAVYAAHKKAGWLTNTIFGEVHLNEIRAHMAETAVPEDSPEEGILTLGEVATEFVIEPRDESRMPLPLEVPDDEDEEEKSQQACGSED